MTMMTPVEPDGKRRAGAIADVDGICAQAIAALADLSAVMQQAVARVQEKRAVPGPLAAAVERDNEEEPAGVRAAR